MRKTGSMIREGKLFILVFLLMALILSSCSMKRYAVNRMGDAMAGSGATFASDDSPELIRAATPFSLKLMESLLSESPEHRGLLLAAASGGRDQAPAPLQGLVNGNGRLGRPDGVPVRPLASLRLAALRGE